MKFFTPDLLLRFGSLDDAIADAAQAEWEMANRNYLKHLEKIRPKLPKDVLPLLDEYCLHDARVIQTATLRDNLGIDFSLAGATRIDLSLKLDTPQDKELILSYELMKPAAFIEHPEFAGERALTEWLYDEFSLARGKQPSFIHSILFTGGLELELRFHDLELTVPKKSKGFLPLGTKRVEKHKFSSPKPLAPPKMRPLVTTIRPTRRNYRRPQLMSGRPKGAAV